MVASTAVSGQTASKPRAARDPLSALREQVKTTPGLLKVALGTIWVLTLLFCVVVYAAARSHRQGMHTVAEDSIPSIIAAQEIKANLADMHSDAANILLGEPGQSPEAVQGYEKRRREVTDQLVSAAKNITYVNEKDADRDERAQIRLLLEHLGAYEGVIAQARLLHERKDSAAALLKQRDADRILHADLFRAADQLDKINREPLNQTYAAERASSGGILAGVLVSGLPLLGVLAATQLFLFRRMRRIVNPGLAAATGVAVAFLIYAVAAFQTETHYLKVVKEDAFDSIHALEQARANAYDANGDESRWLLEFRDKARADAAAQAFQEKSAKLFTHPADLPPARIATLAREDKRLPPALKGFLADELNNVTFLGERAAAADTLDKWLQYVQVDEKIRALEKAGKHDQAVALCLGTKPGESNWAFDQFDKALGKTIKINGDALDYAQRNGYGVLDWATYLSPAAAVGIALLAFLGLWPRLKEYAF